MSPSSPGADRRSSLLNGIIDYENGELDDEQIIELFQELHDTGLAYQLQGSYGRTAWNMLQNGMIEDRPQTGIREAERTYTKEASE